MPLKNNIIFLVLLVFLVSSCKKQGKNPFAHCPDNSQMNDSVLAKLNIEFPEATHKIPFETFTGMYFNEFMEVKIWNEMEELSSVCQSRLLVMQGDKVLDSLNFSNIDPVGFYYGLYLYKELVFNHLLLSKFGDYEGLSIFVNQEGKIFKILGGYMFIDQSNGLVFSNYMSDLNGFSVFDLTLNQEVVRFDNIDLEPLGFYKIDNQYFVSLIDVANQKLIVKSIDLINKKMNLSDLQFSDLKGQELEFLFQPADQ